MKKTILAAALVVVPFVSGQALAMTDDMDMFGGVTLGSSSVYLGGDLSADDSTSSFGLKLGSNFDDFRAYGDLSIASWSDASLTAITGNADYLYTVTEKLDIFAGGHLGFHSFDVDGWDSSGGLGYGFQVGGIYNFSKLVSRDGMTAELGMRYSLSGAEAEVSTYTLEVDNLTNFYVGVNYAF